MYRDAKDVLEDRRRVAIERSERQRASLSRDERALLPDVQRSELAALETRLGPIDATSSAVLSAEELLDEHERLLARARATLKQLAKAERRARRDAAFERLEKQALWRRFWLSLLFVVVVLGGAYAFAYVRLDAECKTSAGCRERGQCHADYSLSCAPETDQDCARSRDCRTYGWCSHAHGDCVVRTSDDCAKTDACLRDQRCTASNGRCERHD